MENIKVADLPVNVATHTPSKQYEGRSHDLALIAERQAVRRKIFLHLDGIAIGPTLIALHDKGVFSLFDGEEEIPLETLQQRFASNSGYLNVALRLMVFQGWMERREDHNSFAYKLTPAGWLAVQLAPYYQILVASVSVLLNLSAYFFDAAKLSIPDDGADFPELIELAKRQWDLPTVKQDDEQVRTQLLYHLNGLLVGPTMVALAMGQVFEKFDPNNHTLDLTQVTDHVEPLQQAFDLLALEGWAMRQGNIVQLTQTGLYATSRAYAYGVTVSYLPTFEKVPDLLFGDPTVLQRRDVNGNETHVDRKMNVWGSGLAHKTYFRKVTSIVVDIFNRPLEQQPKGIIDMGCGDGTLMTYLYQVVRDQTLRGQYLDTHPLQLICADYNQVAREVTIYRLEEAQVPCRVMFGDINDPATFAWDLSRGHQINSQDFLHVRSFLDHNRPFTAPTMGRLDCSIVSCSLKTSGAFARQGHLIHSDELLQNLVEHFQRWAAQIGSHGMLIIDLHTVSPEIAAAKMGDTLATAYDATHGYTDQYPVEYDLFVEAAKMAGLTPDLRYQNKLPSNELPAVSINLFVPCEAVSSI